MGSVKKEKNGTYTVRYDIYENGERKQKKKRGFQLQGKAKSFLNKMENDIEEGEYIIDSNTLFTKYVEDWIDREYTKKVELGQVKPATEEFYLNLFNQRFKDYFLTDKLQTISSKKISAYISFLLEQGLKTNTVLTHFKAIRTVMKYAVKHRDIKRNPMDILTPPKYSKPIIKYWEPEIIDTALKLFEGSDIEFHVQFILFTALREGEVCGLHEDFFNFRKMEFMLSEQAQQVRKKGLVFLDPKSWASKSTMMMNPEIAQLAKKQIMKVKTDRIKYDGAYCEDYLGRLSVRKDGTLIRPKALYHEFSKILKGQEEIPYITVHGLRHTSAVWHLSNDTDMKTLQMILRNAEYKVTTDTYGDASKKMVKNAVSKMSLKSLK